MERQSLGQCFQGRGTPPIQLIMVYVTEGTLSIYIPYRNSIYNYNVGFSFCQIIRL